jgi:hypothetical protein
VTRAAFHQHQFPFRQSSIGRERIDCSPVAFCSNNQLRKDTGDNGAGRHRLSRRSIWSLDGRRSKVPPSPRAGPWSGVRDATQFGPIAPQVGALVSPQSDWYIFRHSAAKLRRDAGESIEEVSRFLDHSSLAVTTTYLRRLEGQSDTSWAKVAEAIGL